VSCQLLCHSHYSKRRNPNKNALAVMHYYPLPQRQSVRQQLMPPVMTIPVLRHSPSVIVPPYAHLNLLSSNLVCRIGQGKVRRPRDTNSRNEWLTVTKLAACVLSSRLPTYNLELTRHDSKVDQLHSGPHQVVCFERRNVNVLELLLNLLAPTSLCH
jgi:hypothetical protein